MKKRLLLLVMVVGLSACGNLFFDKEDNSNLATFDAFYQEIDAHFSFFPLLTINFDSAYTSNRAILQSNPTRETLINRLQEMINVLGDGHTNVYIPQTIRYDFTAKFPVNKLESIDAYLDKSSNSSQVMVYGKIKNENLGYIDITTFGASESNYLLIDRILRDLTGVTGIIIDVRSNGGGNSKNADLIISRFNDQSRMMFRSRERVGKRDEFGAWVEGFTTIFEGTRFTGKVAVLTNRGCYSTTEWFIAGMRTIPQVTVVGDTTGGGSGRPLPRELPNGWAMRISNTQRQLPEGRDYQFSGIYPDVPVWISQAQIDNNIDAILEQAIAILK
ncbi:MAG TPA: hypothetical protein DCS93_27005 [Microscillaceae bacterium]|nr:hypothetical protein [Microscillaceae bacterium]